MNTGSPKGNGSGAPVAALFVALLIVNEVRYIYIKLIYTAHSATLRIDAGYVT